MRIVVLFLLFPVIVYSQEYARIIDKSTTYLIDENQTAEITEHYIIQIKSEKGKRYATYYEYTDKFRKIDDVTIDIISQHGKKIKRLRKSDGVTLGIHPSYEISDAKLFILRADYQEYPFTLEVTSKVKLAGFISLPPWVPQSDFHVGVEHSKLEVVRPVSTKIKFKEEFVSGKSDATDKKLTTRYEVSNLTYVDKKIRYKDFYSNQPKVFVAPEKFVIGNTAGSNTSWIEFGDWFLKLNSDPYKLTRKTTAFIDSLDKGDKRKLIKDIFEYMQDKTRYVSIQLGIGGFKSLPTEDVERYGYGDCKALTTYMKNMLHYAGIKSNYVLVYAGNDVPDVKPDFPVSQFNHVFLGIPLSTDTVFLECTSQILPTDYIGSFTDDRNVLWLENNSSEIIRSRRYDHNANTQRNIVKMNLDKSGNVTADFDIMNTGVFFDEIMLYSLAPNDYIKEHNQDKFTFPDFTIKDFTYKQPKRGSSVFNSKYLLQINGLAKAAGDKLVLPIVPTIPVHKYIDKDELMKFYSIKRGITITDEIEVNLGQNYWIYNLPEAESIDSPFGAYNLSIKAEENRLMIRRTMVFYKGDYQGNKYEEFKLFYDKLEKLEGRKLILNSKT